MKPAILMYHAVHSQRSPVSITAQDFEQHMQILKERDVKVISLQALLHQQRIDPAVAEKSLAITFDDGLESIYTQALPVLALHGFPATVFLVTNYIGQHNDWPEQSGNIPLLPMLNWDQIKEMDQYGIEFGAHTMNHPHLSLLPAREAQAEILDSKRIIEDRLGKPVSFFAYPYGEVDPRSKSIVQGAFSGACGTRLGYIHTGSDPYDLERIDVYYFNNSLLFSHLQDAAMAPYLYLRRMLRNFRKGWYDR